MNRRSRHYPSSTFSTPSGRFGLTLLLILGLWSVVAHAEQFRYRYVSLNELAPPGSFFDPVGIDDRDRVYGTVYDFPDATNANIAVYEDGVLTNLQPGYALLADGRGTVGGAVLYDSSNYLFQAALFRGDRVELIPFQPGEISSEVRALGDRGAALVSSYTSDGSSLSSIYRKGQSLLLDLDPGLNPYFINDKGVVAGSTAQLEHGFRFDPRDGELTLLDPVPPDPRAWSQGINKHGDVLGYSFVNRALERIGVWDRDGNFRTHFTQGTRQFPTKSNRLLFNDRNLIVITKVSNPIGERGDSYLVPKPGVRLNLADAVENMPAEQKLETILDINNRGSMIGRRGFVDPEYFLLKRIRSADR